MTTYRDRTLLKIGNRLGKLRNERGLSQAEFAREFAVYCGLPKPYTVATVSSWEQNYRYPPIPTLVQLARFYDVSSDYLLGITKRKTDSTGSTTKSDSKRITSYDVPIKKDHLVDYDGFPVYVSFRNIEHIEQWGLLHYEANIIKCKEFDISLNDDIDVFPIAEIPMQMTHISRFEQLLTTDIVMIKMKSSDSAVCEYYNGRYQHNADKTFLIKIDNNIPLPYAGLGVSYYAFKG